MRGTIASGGAVLKMMGDEEGRLWVASPAGLFCREDSVWRAVRRGVSAFWRVNTVAGNGRHLWLTGMPYGILRSANGGETWHPCWVEQTNEPVVAIAPSPDFRQDRVLLAATDGDGILRSTDGGRHWELANFGLREFVMVDVVMAPKIGRYEYAFAITENGFYQSPNGGRAWKLIEFGQEIRPIALAIGPHFVDDKVVCVGTEAGELFISQDAGLSWQYVSDAFDGVNGITFATDGTPVIGTESAIYRLDNKHNSLQSPVANLSSPLLSLATIGDMLYAGLVNGLWVSADNGRSWQPDDSLTARRMLWYVKNELAGGTEEGVWQTADGGQTWQPIWDDLPVLGLAIADDEIWVSGVEGLAVSADKGESWQMAWAAEGPLTALAAVNGVVWAGNSSGKVWRGERGAERGWQEVAVPFSTPQQLVGFVVVEDVLLAVSWSPVNNVLQLWWRTAEDWQLWFSQSSGAVLPQVAVSEGRALVGLGSFVYRLAESGWQRQRVGSMEAPITAVCAVPGGWLTAVTDALLYSANGVSWQPLENGLQGEPIVALNVVDGQLMVGTADGKVWVNPLE